MMVTVFTRPAGSTSPYTRAFGEAHIDPSYEGEWARWVGDQCGPGLDVLLMPHSGAPLYAYRTEEVRRPRSKAVRA